MWVHVGVWRSQGLHVCLVGAGAAGFPQACGSVDAGSVSERLATDGACVPVVFTQVFRLASSIFMCMYV